MTKQSKDLEGDAKALRKEADLLVLSSPRYSDCVQDHLLKAAGYLRQEAEKLDEERAQALMTCNHCEHIGADWIAYDAKATVWGGSYAPIPAVFVHRCCKCRQTYQQPGETR